MKGIVLKANLRLKRHNRSRFNRQAVHQIALQVMNNEKEKVFKVNEALAKIDMMIQPVLLPEFSMVGEDGDRIRMVSELINELPEPEYLFAVQDFVGVEQEKQEEKQREGDAERDEPDRIGKRPEPETELLVQDDEEKLEDQERVEEEQRKELVDKYEAEVAKELKEQMAGHQQRKEAMKLQYTELREELVRLNNELVYKLKKLEYLRQLSEKLEFLEKEKEGERADSEDEDSEVEESSINLKVQMSRFRILVEKLQFAMK